jgi:hypothetical protein
MPLDLTLAPSPRSSAHRVAIDETLLSELPPKLGVKAPIWSKLSDGAYDDPELTMREVESLAAETRLLRDRWLVQTGQHPLSKRPDPTREMLERLLEVCEAALTAGVGLVGASD